MGSEARGCSWEWGIQVERRTPGRVALALWIGREVGLRQACCMVETLFGLRFYPYVFAGPVL